MLKDLKKYLKVKSDVKNSLDINIFQKTENDIKNFKKNHKK